jgi:peptide/nickel transport system substrate-binding protein
MLRLMALAGILFFMGMLYWSSVLIEDDIKSLRIGLERFGKDIGQLRREVKQVRRSMESGVAFSNGSDRSAARADRRPHMNADYPNLLSEDSFYTSTLPGLLPDDFEPKGIRRAATMGKPDDLNPFAGYAEVSSWVRLCQESLSRLQFGRYEDYAPALAIKIEERPSRIPEVPEFWVHLREGVMWQPLQQAHFPEDVQLSEHFLQEHPVTAKDFKFYWDALMNPHNQLAGAVALRNYYGDIAEIEIVDDLTFIVRWNAETVEENGEQRQRVKYVARGLTSSLTPLASWVYQYFPDGSKIVEDDSDPETYRKDSIWAQNFAVHWARHVIPSCGEWIFDGMTDEKILFKRNPDFHNPLAVLVEEYEIRFKESPDGIWQDFKAGRLDTYALQPDQLIELEEFQQTDTYKEQSRSGKAIHRLDYVGRVYSYIGWNQQRPFFGSRKVRQAMTMAIDRQRIIAQNRNGMGVAITGPFFVYSPSYNGEIDAWPYSPIRAQELLEEEGWYDASGTGIREKEINGEQVPLRFRLTYYVKNPTSKAIADYISTAMSEIGVDCQLNGVDTSDLSSEFEDKEFDALIMGWALGTPPENPRQLWHSMGAKQKGSSNAVGFANAEADSIIEALDYEYEAEDRARLYHRFHEILHEEQPYTFLYTPKSVFLYRDYVQNVFIPAERQDLIPGASWAEPASEVFWLKEVPGAS